MVLRRHSVHPWIKAVLICLLFFLWLRIRINSKRWIVSQWKPTNTPRKPDCYRSAAFIRIMTITGKSFNFLQTMAVRGSRSIRCIKVWRLMISDFCASLTVRKNTVWSPLHMPDTTLVFREKNNPFLYTYAICWMKSNRPAWFWHIWAAGDVGIRLWIASLDEMYI